MDNVRFMEEFSSFVSNKEPIDLSKSLLNEDDGIWLFKSDSHTGVAAFDEELRVLPLISEFLSYNLRNNKISPHTAKTYAKNLIYFLARARAWSYFKQLRPFQDTRYP